MLLSSQKPTLRTSMLLSDAITLIKHPSVPSSSISTWADLGCGAGLFTQALSTLLAEGSIIYAIDKVSVNRLPDHFNNIRIEKTQLDFVTAPLPASSLHGILMGNSLHYVKEQLAFIKKAEAHLQSSGSFLIVEYDTDRSNPWVPYPLSFVSLKKLFNQAGYTSVEKINERPSAYGRYPMYAAVIHH